MSQIITTAGEGLIARLFAEGKPLIIDCFLFAHIKGQDHTAPLNPGQDIPAINLVHMATIPPEYRAFINPNQVVYSALIGSDVGDFHFNWQGLYCSEHEVLVAFSTFPALESRAYDEATNTPGNNLTRNFMLDFSGAQRLTGVTIEASVWQLDFTVRLKGIDERERLSNRDIYGRAAFLEDGWKLAREYGRYVLLPGAGYVEGIRIALAKKLEVFPPFFPCEVWLDVCMEPEGSDVVAKARILFLPEGETRPDYVTPTPYRIPHYLEKIAHVPAGPGEAHPGGEPESTRPDKPGHAFCLFHLSPEAELLISIAERGDAFLDARTAPGILPPGASFTLEDGALFMHLP